MEIRSAEKNQDGAFQGAAEQHVSKSASCDTYKHSAGPRRPKPGCTLAALAVSTGEHLLAYVSESAQYCLPFGVSIFPFSSFCVSLVSLSCLLPTVTEDLL